MITRLRIPKCSIHGYIGWLLAALLVVGACKKSPVPGPDEPASAAFAKGADVSWLTQQEAAGVKFYNKAGTQTDLFTLLKSLGMNTIRLRVWVNPAQGWCGQADVVAKALRAQQAGLQVMINFHYSDSWADPGKQTIPAAWAGYTTSQLAAAVGQHTTDVLTALKQAGVSPAWVQVGNETNDGMLWPNGRASAGGMAAYAQSVNAGYNAVKAVLPKAKVMVHLSNGFDNALYTWNLGGLVANGAQFDVIGLSLYPAPTNWQSLNAQCFSNMQNLVNRYARPVMVVEVGMPWDAPAACQQFLQDLMAKIKAVPGSQGLGLLYWEPQSYAGWQGYTLGAFDNNGRPTIALDAFAN